MRSGYQHLREVDMAKKVTDNRLDRLEKASTDDDSVRIVVDWSTDGLSSSTDPDVLQITWSDIDGDLWPEG